MSKNIDPERLQMLGFSTHCQYLEFADRLASLSDQRAQLLSARMWDMIHTVLTSRGVDETAIQDIRHVIAKMTGLAEQILGFEKDGQLIDSTVQNHLDTLVSRSLAL